jgi:hypothetical protein
MVHLLMARLLVREDLEVIVEGIAALVVDLEGMMIEMVGAHQTTGLVVVAAIVNLLAQDRAEVVTTIATESASLAKVGMAEMITGNDRTMAKPTTSKETNDDINKQAC